MPRQKRFSAGNGQIIFCCRKRTCKSDSADEPIGNLSYVKKSFHEYVLAHRAQRGAPQFRIPNSEFRIDVLILARKEETRYYAKL